MKDVPTGFTKKIKLKCQLDQFENEHCINFNGVSFFAIFGLIETGQKKKKWEKKRD